MLCDTIHIFYILRQAGTAPSCPHCEIDKVNEYMMYLFNKIVNSNSIHGEHSEDDSRLEGTMDFCTLRWSTAPFYLQYLGSKK